MPGALSGRRMLPSGLCLGRWQLLRTIRARGRGDPRELPSTPQVRRGAGSGASGGKFALGKFGRSESSSLRAAPHPDRWWPRATCPGAVGETGQERPARGASPGSAAR